MTLSEQDQADTRLQQAHARFATVAEASEAVSPARILIGVVRAGLAIGITALRSRNDVDPITIRPRVLGA